MTLLPSVRFSLTKLADSAHRLSILTKSIILPSSITLPYAGVKPQDFQFSVGYRKALSPPPTPHLSALIRPTSAWHPLRLNWAANSFSPAAVQASTLEAPWGKAASRAANTSLSHPSTSSPAVPAAMASPNTRSLSSEGAGWEEEEEEGAKAEVKEGAGAAGAE